MLNVVESVEVRAWSTAPRTRAAWAVVVLLGLSAGCNPITTGVKYGVRIVGDVIEDEDVKQKGQELVGRPFVAADQAFGARIDEFKDARSDRRWRTYPVKLDVLDRQRYVVETLGGKIVSVSKADKSSRKIDIPRVLILKEKFKGRSPRECEAGLEFGSPVLEVRSTKTRSLVQLYDATMMTDLGTPHYCIVRYDEKDRCSDLEFIAIGASTKEDPIAR